MMESSLTCPVCEGSLYPWASLSNRQIDRCEQCGAGVERGVEVNPAATLGAIASPRGDHSLALEAPNRASIQAGLGAEAWAALADSPGPLLLTPRSLELLARRGGLTVTRVRFPLLGRNQAWMWRTMLNGLTFHPNFPGEARSGRLRPAGAIGQLKFAIDAVVTVLAAPLIALASFPLEIAGALLRRGGVMVARAQAAVPPAAARPGADEPGT
jgi:hypothetical protein